ncbi:hypothetical protein EVAR_50232_1 [Eumeta japonica]|uniref:Uncharacterized protein n=1 Tax=Eumeta variegata TaxID=151549 RepID=A0A4C2A5K0_EUMVA|nr:hypothetical protein EVAR_50232_1 [Eumeta japonica]
MPVRVLVVSSLLHSSRQLAGEKEAIRDVAISDPAHECCHGKSFALTINCTVILSHSKRIEGPFSSCDDRTPLRSHAQSLGPECSIRYGSTRKRFRKSDTFVERTSRQALASSDKPTSPSYKPGRCDDA